MTRHSTPVLLLWCMYPLSVLLFHTSVGERWQSAEKAMLLREQGLALEQSGELYSAANHYSAAEEYAHSADVALRARLAIDLARLAIAQGFVFEGIEKMERLLAASHDKSLPSPLRAEANATCAMGLYYAAYALRLDNNAPELWQPEAAEARSIFLRLYEQARRLNQPEEIALFGTNLEASIRLQREKLAEIAVNPPPPASLAARDKSVFRKKMERLERREKRSS
jgi:hypothetical protein